MAEAGRRVSGWTTQQESWRRGIPMGTHTPQALRPSAPLPPRRSSQNLQQLPSWNEEVWVLKCISVAETIQSVFVLSVLGDLIRNVYACMKSFFCRYFTGEQHSNEILLLILLFMPSLYLWLLNLEHFTIQISAFCSKQKKCWGFWLGVYIISANCGKAAMTSRCGSLQLSCSQGECTQLLHPAWCKTAMYHPGLSAMVPWSWALHAESSWKPINKQQGSLLSYEPGWHWVPTRFLSCHGYGDIPVTQLIHKEEGWKSSWDGLQMRTLQCVAHWYTCPSEGITPLDTVVWHEDERKIMRESFSLPSPWEWVQAPDGSSEGHNNQLGSHWLHPHQQ